MYHREQSRYQAVETQIIDCVTKFSTGVPTELGRGMTRYKSTLERVVPTYPYSTESCNKEGAYDITRDLM